MGEGGLGAEQAVPLRTRGDEDELDAVGGGHPAVGGGQSEPTGVHQRERDSLAEVRRD